MLHQPSLPSNMRQVSLDEMESISQGTWLEEIGGLAVIDSFRYWGERGSELESLSGGRIVDGEPQLSSGAQSSIVDKVFTADIVGKRWVAHRLNDGEHYGIRFNIKNGYSRSVRFSSGPEPSIVEWERAENYKIRQLYISHSQLKEYTAEKLVLQEEFFYTLVLGVNQITPDDISYTDKPFG